MLSSTENSTSGRGKVTATEEEVKTKRLHEGVFAQALRALRAPLTAMERARSRLEFSLMGAATWINPSTPGSQARLAIFFYPFSVFFT